MLAKGIDLKADVLKLGHHGSSSSTSIDYLNKVSPTYAVICVGKGNQYGHPTDLTLQKLANKNIQTFRTDLNGTIVFTSDGNNITVNTNAIAPVVAQIVAPVVAPEVAPAVAAAVEPAVAPASSTIMVHITKTGKKYHVAGCASLSKSDSEVTLDKAISLGLGPCELCHPPTK